MRRDERASLHRHGILPRHERSTLRRANRWPDRIVKGGRGGMDHGYFFARRPPVVRRPPEARYALASRAAGNWASRRPTSATCSASLARRSAAGGRPTPPQGSKANRPHERTGRPSARVGPFATCKPSASNNCWTTTAPGRPAASPSPLWSRRAVGDLIRQEFGVRLAVRTVGEYLKRWGYTAKKPARHSRDQDPGRSPPMAGGNPSGYRKAGRGGRGGHLLVRRETGSQADQHPGCGYARE